MPKHEAVAVLQQIAHGFRSLPEHGRNAVMNFRRTVRLVAAGETARKHDDLAVLNKANQLRRAFGNRLGRQVVDDERLGHGTCAFERAGRSRIRSCCPGNTGMMTRGFAMVPLYTSGAPS